MTFARPPDTFPSGTIVPVNTSVSDIPVGWVLCDGNNGTPDLREKYIKSTMDATSQPGAQVGQDSVNLSESQLPSHSHGGTTPDSNSDHTHDFDTTDNSESGFDPDEGTIGGVGSLNTTTNGAHSHQDITSTATGGGGSIDNRPEYTEMLLIKKL